MDQRTLQSKKLPTLKVYLKCYFWTNIVVVLLGFPKGIKVSIAQGAQPRGQY